MKKQFFLTVVQRRALYIEESLMPLYGPLFTIETHLSMEERVELAFAALQLPGGFMACEVGSYLGASACFLAAGASLRGGMVHCVDAWDHRAMGAETRRSDYEEFRRNTAPFAAHIVVHSGEASVVAPRVPGGLDLLFIDGDHTREGALADLENYVPKLKPGGLLLLHDYDLAGVSQACMEFQMRQALSDAGRRDTLQGFRVPKGSSMQGR